MNNLEQAPGILLDDAKRITPRIALNVEVRDGGKLVRRQGYALHIPLPGAHSLWAGSVMLVVAAGILYRVEGNTAMPIGTVPGLQATVCYAELDNLIYMGTPSWEAVYELLSGQVRSWGLSLPPAPSVSLVAGDMPPGTYSLCYTRTDGDRLSGNGPMTTVSWEGGTHGIRLNNLPASGQCWVTHPNGTDFFLANVSGGVLVRAPQDHPAPNIQGGAALWDEPFRSCPRAFLGVQGKEPDLLRPFYVRVVPAPELQALCGRHHHGGSGD